MKSDLVTNASTMEEAILLGKTKSLVGVVTDPAERDACLPAVILLNAGIVHRVGPNRMHVRIARELAASGFVVLRFDFSGIGDSRIREDSRSFAENMIEETQEAMDYLERARSVRRFILIGLCSGATVSYQTACCDRRVAGAILINPAGHLHDTTNHELNDFLRARTLALHYRRMAFARSFRRKSWIRTMTGAVDYWSILKAGLKAGIETVFGRTGLSADGAREALERLRSLSASGVRLLHVYSEADESLDYPALVLGDEMKRLKQGGQLKMEIILGSNHSFTLRWSQDQLLNVILAWVRPMIPSNDSAHETRE